MKIHTYIRTYLWYNINIDEVIQVKVNKTISIDLKTLNEMVKYCNKANVTFSGLIAKMWEEFSKFYN